MKYLVFVIVIGWVCSQPLSPGASPGAPLRGVTPRELELFRSGLDDFTEVESAEDGLGPAYNGTSCASCHSVPAIGGVTAMTELHAAYVDEDGKFHPIEGGTLRHLFSIPNHRCQVQVPESANLIARRMPLPVFGDGLVEAIADHVIAAQSDPDDLNGDGISGRVAWVTDLADGRTRAGRFGWKAQHATLLAFSADAYRNEMGITNELLPNEFALGIDPETMKECSPKRSIEDVRDRRTGLRGIDQFTNFMRLLAPIDRAPSTPAAVRGAELFAEVGCAACHTPSMTTQSDGNPLFDRKPVPLYSDLLLHDVGTGDGIEQGAAAANEIRTPPLWGLRLRRPLLHDGSEQTLAGAIRRHSGEAARSREQYELLGPGKELVRAFLDSL